MWDKLIYGWIGSNCMMICKKKYRRFNLHLHFPFNCITWGREIHHKHCKTLFLKTHRTAASWMPFFDSWWKVLSFFFTPAPCSVWKCTPLCWFSRSSVFLKFRMANFLLKKRKTIQGSLHLICIINRLHKWATCKRKWNKCSKQDGSPHPTKAWSDLRFCEVCIFRRLLAFFVLFDYAVSVS